MLLPLHLGFGHVNQVWNFPLVVSGQNIFGFGSLEEGCFVTLSVGSYS